MITSSFRILSCVLLLCSTTVVSMAQGKITLSHFSFTPSRLEVGKVISASKGEATPKVKIVGSNAKLFKLEKDNTLRLKKAPQEKWLDLVLETSAAGGTVQDTFRIVRDEFVKNRVIAHRGAFQNTGATENSIAALQHAIRLGCAGSEFDVHMSSDSVPFVFHDHTFNGIDISKTPAAELAQLRLPNGESLPTLDAYLKAGLAQNNTRLILEIKPKGNNKAYNKALAQKVVEAVRQHKAQGWVDYISFGYDVLLEVQRLEPHAHLSYLNGEKAPAELAKDNMYGFDYNLGVVRKNPHWIKEAHQLNLTVNVWTVNDPAMMDWLLNQNVEFITTNEPEMLLEKVKKLAAK